MAAVHHRTYTSQQSAHWLAAKVGYALRRAQKTLDPQHDLSRAFALADELLQVLGNAMRPQPGMPLQSQVRQAPAHVGSLAGLLTAIAQPASCAPAPSTSIPHAASPPLNRHAPAWKSWAPAAVVIQRWWRRRSSRRISEQSPTSVALPEAQTHISERDVSQPQCVSPKTDTSRSPPMLPTRPQIAQWDQTQYVGTQQQVFANDLGELLPACASQDNFGKARMGAVVGDATQLALASQSHATSPSTAPLLPRIMQVLAECGAAGVDSQGVPEAFLLGHLTPYAPAVVKRALDELVAEGDIYYDNDGVLAHAL